MTNDTANNAKIRNGLNLIPKNVGFHDLKCEQNKAEQQLNIHALI